MNRKKVWRWCEKNNWTEPRQLNTGDWVAFPPGGLIEMPLPQEIQFSASNSLLLDTLSAFVLIMSGLVLAVISIAISPLFLAGIIRRYRQRRSMP